jgi:hypothetical protein
MVRERKYIIVAKSPPKRHFCKNGKSRSLYKGGRGLPECDTQGPQYFTFPQERPTNTEDSWMGESIYAGKRALPIAKDTG